MTALEDIYIYIVGDIYRYIVGDIYRYILKNIFTDAYRYMVGYLQIQGFAESQYRHQRLFSNVTHKPI